MPEIFLKLFGFYTGICVIGFISIIWFLGLIHEELRRFNDNREEDEDE